MAEIGTIIDFVLPFILGAGIGVFFGVFVASLMNVSSADSREREWMEQIDKNRADLEFLVWLWRSHKSEMERFVREYNRRDGGKEQ